MKQKTLIEKIDDIGKKIEKNKSDIKFLKKEIHRNKNYYGILRLDCRELIKTIDEMLQNKYKYMQLVKKQNLKNKRGNNGNTI